MKCLRNNALNLWKLVALSLNCTHYFQCDYVDSPTRKLYKKVEKFVKKAFSKRKCILDFIQNSNAIRETDSVLSGWNILV